MSDLRALTVETTPPYQVRIGADALGASSDLTDGCDVLFADEHVHALHGERLGDEGRPLLLLPQGEEAKSLAELERALDFLCQNELDRSATLLVLGGGAATDLGGLAAALYLRGVSWIACPTTLLAMVDASVGGKTAVNLKSGKNLAGSFHQPAAVIADTQTLATLSGEEYASGLGEVLKTALIEGEELLSFLEAEAPALLARDTAVTAEVIARCVETKARIVASDPCEAGPRKALNLGHTFAHAIEQTAGPGLIPHGVAVAVGCALALQASSEIGLLSDADLPARAARIAESLCLPTNLAALRESSAQPLAAAELIAAMTHDKKAAAGVPRFVLPRSAGNLALDAELDPMGILT